MGIPDKNTATPPAEPVENADKKTGLSNWKIAGLGALLILAIVACIAVTFFIFGQLGESLNIAEATPTEAEDISAPVEPTERTSACAGTGTMKILLLGVDAPNTSEPKGADAIRLMYLDFANSEVTMVALPRDLWVATPTLNNLGIYDERLGITYYHAKEHNPEGTDKAEYGTKVVAQVLYDNFGFLANHYITVHIDNFDEIVNALGGVELNVPQEYKSVNYTFSPGVQTLDGNQALEYASNLLGEDTEWDRFNRQDILLQAVSNQVTKPQILTRIPAIISEFSNTITTDFSVAELTDLTCLLTEVSMGEIQYIDVDQTMVTTQPDSAILQPNVEGITTMLKEIFN